MKITRAFIAALVVGCLCTIVSADVAHKVETTPAAAHPEPAHSDPAHPHPKAAAPSAAHDQAAAVVAASAPKAPTTPASTTIATPPVCGNGIIEHGEECDCGSPQECAKDPCCNAKTCKLNAGAQCSNQQECCNQCQFRPSTFVCRSATSECDAVEMCSGKSGKCPTNKKTCPKSHSSVPSNSTTSCGAELCTERDLQCQSQQSDSNYNFASACPTASASCQMSCSDPTDIASHPPRCVSLLVHFEDGTACGEGGVCTSGTCVGDKSNSAFFKKNTITFAIGGGCIVVAFFFCFFGIICSRRRKRLQRQKERKQEDSYQMAETNDRDLYRKSNIRIGLDPNENGMVDVLTPYDGSYGSGNLTRRPSATALARAGGRSAGPYAPDALLTEQEMALALESDSNQRMGGPSLSNWPAPPISRERTGYFDIPPTGGGKGKGTLQKSPSVANHIVYVPPPLPPPAITTPTTSKTLGVVSPYADDAMIVFPPDSPPRSANSGAKPPSSQQAPHIRIGEPASSSSSSRGPASTMNDDEPSFLDLNNTLTVDRYNKAAPAKDRTSVNSFFSGLALDDPSPESYSLPPILPEPSFASEEYVMPAPIARVIPVPTSRGITPPSPVPSAAIPPLPVAKSPKSNNSNAQQQSAYERQQEEYQVASCFAQDLGFEIVHPSPAGSPRHKAATPTGSRRL
ncbi:hypothetical protein BGZ88_011577 [Linnemannia elongata]|nr:hypothetical protein BGZ88_011577 [Linnemannia elongata]